MRAQLKDWRKQIEDLETQSKDKVGATRTQFQESANRLRERAQEFERMLQSGAHRTGKAWNEFQVQAEASWADLKRGLTEAARAFRVRPIFSAALSVVETFLLLDRSRDAEAEFRVIWQT
jgi:hypothetical protein